MDDIYRFELGKFLHHHHNNLLPNSFSTYLQELSVVHQLKTRASARGDYKIIRCKKHLAKDLLGIKEQKFVIR